MYLHHNHFPLLYIYTILNLHISHSNQNNMAISNFTAISQDDWNRISIGYTQIIPLLNPSGSTDPNLSVSWYVNNSDNTAFAIRISSTGQETLLLTNSTSADQLDLQCTSSNGGQGNIWHTLNENQGWTKDFNLSISLTNTNSSKGKMTFTKGKSDKPHR